MIRKIALLMFVLTLAGAVPALHAEDEGSTSAPGVTSPAKPAKKPMRRLLMAGKKPAKKPATPAARKETDTLKDKAKKDKDKPYGWERDKKKGWEGEDESRGWADKKDRSY
ncbi:MAG: hypothetical protein MOGMAGMI_01590 [Candidatus Omnitrophica bacterium]|nr:hypothetical protein [Candidatus Omnitrophota bacterium]